MLLLRSWTAPEDTNVIIVFDNTYSMMRPKTIASPSILEAFGKIWFVLANGCVFASNIFDFEYFLKIWGPGTLPRRPGTLN